MTNKRIFNVQLAIPTVETRYYRMKIEASTQEEALESAKSLHNNDYKNYLERIKSTPQDQLDTVHFEGIDDTGRNYFEEEIEYEDESPDPLYEIERTSLK